MEIPTDLIPGLYVVVTDIVIIAFAVVALITAGKRAVATAAGVECLEHRVAQVVLHAAPLLLGAGLGLISGFLPDYEPGPKLVVGLIAGFLSPAIYRFAGKRFPDLLLAGHSAKRTSSDEVSP